MTHTHSRQSTAVQVSVHCILLESHTASAELKSFTSLVVLWSFAQHTQWILHFTSKQLPSVHTFVFIYLNPQNTHSSSMTMQIINLSFSVHVQVNPSVFDIFPAYNWCSCGDTGHFWSFFLSDFIKLPLTLRSESIKELWDFHRQFSIACFWILPNSASCYWCLIVSNKFINQYYN